MTAAADDEWPEGEDPGPAWPTARWVLLAVWLAVIGYMTLSAVQPHASADAVLRGLLRMVTGHPWSASTTSGRWEQAANVALFVPLGLLVTLALRRDRRWLAPVLCFAISAAVELLQDVLVTTRTASWGDVAANTLGGVIGWLIGRPLIGHLRRRRRRRAAA